MTLSPHNPVRGEYEVIRRIALEAERLGFQSFWLNDHFSSYPLSGVPFLECWVTLSALASETSSIRLGTLCTCNSHRNPSVLAKMASTFDVISGGRLDLGIGAGWYEAEYVAYGIPYYTTPVRISQLHEAVQIIKKMWTDEKTFFRGKYYTMEGAYCSPKPIQKPHPPIWICGKGEKLLLRVVAELGDGYNFISCAPKEHANKLEVLKRYCLNLGRDIRSIKKSCTPAVFIAEDEAEVKKKIEAYRLEEQWRHLPLDELIERSLAGTPDQCIKRIQELETLGVTHFILNFPDAHNLKSISLFAEKVIPAFKQ